MIERIDPPGPGGLPFSGAVVAGPFVFVSGQVGTDLQTGKLPPGVKDQTRNVLANIEAKLSKAGCGLKDVVKATVFLLRHPRVRRDERGLSSRVRTRFPRALDG